MSSYPPSSYPSQAPPPGWGSPHPVAQAPYAGSLPPSAPAAGRSPLLIVAVVMAAAALLLGVVSLLVALSGGTDAPPGEDEGGGWGTLRGQVSASQGTLTGAALADAVQQTIRDDGEDSSAMSCPDTARVAQNVTTVCHGRVDGDDWAVVVFFEDTSGRYTLLPA